MDVESVSIDLEDHLTVNQPVLDVYHLTQRYKLELLEYGKLSPLQKRLLSHPFLIEQNGSDSGIVHVRLTRKDSNGNTNLQLEDRIPGELNKISDEEFSNYINGRVSGYREVLGSGNLYHPFEPVYSFQLKDKSRINVKFLRI